MPKETVNMDTIFAIVTSTKTTTELSEIYGVPYKKVASLRRSKKYKVWWHHRMTKV